MGFFECIPLAKASQIIQHALKDYKLQKETLPIMQALGTVAAEDIFSRVDIPSFSRSTMDGFAVRSIDTVNASADSPVELKIIGEVRMGEGTDLVLKQGEAAHIPTGGMLPKGADAVVMVEYSQQKSEDTVLIKHSAYLNENIIKKGEDVSAGQLLVSAGTKIGSRQIALLAANGVDKISVRRKLRVAILSTGNELVEVGTELKEGQIWNSNSYALSSLVDEAGYTSVRCGIVKDSLEEFTVAISDAIKKYDTVLISGGSSVGLRDFTVTAIEALGKPGVLFHGLMIKPGKPTIFAKIGETPVFGLPGHPLSAITILEAIVLPAFAIMAGEMREDRVVLKARLMKSITSDPSRENYIYTKLVWKNGEYQAFPIIGKSGMVRLFSDADGMLKVPVNKTGLDEGEVVEVFNIHRITKE